MTTALESSISQALYRAKRMEMLLHSRGRWSVQVCGETYPAIRLIGHDSILVRSSVIGDGQRHEAVLLCNGDPVAWQSLDTYDGEFLFEWVFRPSMVERIEQ